MNSFIILVAETPILINEINSSLEGILTKIIQWIELIINYGTILNDKELFKSFNIDDTFFTQEMRLASLGLEYKNWNILPKILHESGEIWYFDKLIECSNTGLVEWYCNKFNLTKDEYIKVCKNKDIQILGVFYHRMKIIMENIYKIFDFFSGKNIYGLFNLSCIQKLMSRRDFQIKNQKLYELCIKIKKYKDIQYSLTINYLNLEKALEYSQIALFNHIKDKSFL